MEVSKTIIATIIVATLSSHAPRASYPSELELRIAYFLPPLVSNATQEILNIYPFIKSSNYLRTTVLFLPNNITRQMCTLSQNTKDKLSIAYKKLIVFRRPLYIAFSYEENQGPQHSRVAKALRYTSSYFNGTTSYLRRRILQKGFSVPTDYSVSSEADLNQIVRRYLKLLVDRNFLDLVITDDVVKSYKNYVILYTLIDVVREASACVYGL